jgi:putative transposase
MAYRAGKTKLSLQGTHIALDLMFSCVRWYAVSPLNDRRLEEMMLERGVVVDHSVLNRWVLEYAPQLEQAFHRRKRLVCISWRMEETSIRVRGRWHYLYRAVDKRGPHH